MTELDRHAVLAAIRSGDMWGLPLLAVADRVAAGLDVSAESVESLLVELVDSGTIDERGTGWGELHPGDTPNTDVKGGVRAPKTALQRADSGGYAAIFAAAQQLADVPVWSYVDERHVRAALDRAGFAQLLDDGDLFGVSGWQHARVDERSMWYYGGVADTRPDELRRFVELLVEDAPADYEPHLIKLRKGSKAPALDREWKQHDARLSLDDAVELMQQGHNIGIAGTDTDPLVNIDVDDDDRTTPDELPGTLRARSRSRTGWHAWGFDEHAGTDDAIPNIATGTAGEVRSSWQYVVAPGSMVGSLPDSVPADDPDCGRYTIESAESVATIELDELPEVFIDAHAERQDQQDEQAARDTPDYADIARSERSSNSRKSAVYDVDAAELVNEKDSSARFASIFHGSDTGMNMSVSDGLLHCWRHNCTHGGMQALATLAAGRGVDHMHGLDCGDIGTQHNSGGSSRLAGDWRLVWGAWIEAKDRRLIAADDPLPYRVLRELAVADGVVDRDELVVRRADDGTVVEHAVGADGPTYQAVPPGSYGVVLRHVRDTYGVDPGRDMPEYSDPDDAEPVGVLPAAVRQLAERATVGVTDTAGTIDVDHARQRTVDTIEQAIDSRGQVLVDALPTMGKSYGTVAAAARSGRPVSILTGRGRVEQYEQLRQWCSEHGLDYLTLPAFTRDCPTASGEHGDDWRDRVMSWYGRGATAGHIHAHAEQVTDEPLPCQQGEHTCPYASLWDFDPDDYDVLIGHYTHAHKPKVTVGRAVLLDEYPGNAYELQLSADELARSVRAWLDSDEVHMPVESVADILEHRDEPEVRAGVLAHYYDPNGAVQASSAKQVMGEHFGDVDRGGLDRAVDMQREVLSVRRDESAVLGDDAAHAAAPLAVFGLLAGESASNGLERMHLPPVVTDDTVLDGGTSLYDRETGELSILTPPPFIGASAVVGLDGTATCELWNTALGMHMEHCQVLDDDERAEYLQHGLEHRIVQTSPHIKPYNNPDHVHVESDAALLDAIDELHGESPDLISTRSALGEYEQAGVSELYDSALYYGNLLGSNQLAEQRVGAVIGSTHYGDRWVQRWAAYHGHTVDEPDRSEHRGSSLTYGEFGDRLLQHMREHQVLQAALRFGRDGGGAVVYVHTAALPEWVPVAGQGRVVRTWSDGMREVVDALGQLDTATTAELAEHSAVSIGERQVLGHLRELVEQGAVRPRHDPDDGRRLQWVGGSLHRFNEHGVAELDPTPLDELSESEVREVARSIEYTWDFVKIRRDTSTAVLDGRVLPMYLLDPEQSGVGDPPPNA
jgi:hypothetical protein